MSNTILIYALIPLLLWFIISIVYWIKAEKNFSSVNPYFFDSVPSIFTTSGVLGTFIGIAIALWDFDVNNIDESIPHLLSGLTASFWTSIAGIILSVIASKIFSGIQFNSEVKEENVSNELAALRELIKLNTEGNTLLIKIFSEFKSVIIGESEYSISSQLSKFRSSLIDSIRDLHRNNEHNSELLTQIKHSLGGEEETSLLTQIIKLRNSYDDQSNTFKNLFENLDKNGLKLIEKQDKIIQQNDNLKSQFDENIKEIINTLYTATDMMKEKFDEFAKLLAESNTKALVEAMEKVIVDFNDKMKELIDKLIKENFEELNQSVQKLNDWQVAYSFRGRGSTYERVNIINQIYDQSVPVLKDDKSQHQLKFLREIIRIVKSSLDECGAKYQSLL